MQKDTVVAVGGVFGQVRSIFTQGSEIKNQPTKNLLRDKEVVLGVLADSATKSFFSKASGLRNGMNEKMKEHVIMHLSGKAHEPEVCASFHREIGEMESQSEVFSRLFWEGVFQAFPNGANYGVRSGWQVVCLDDPETGDESLFGEMHPSRTFFADLHRAFTLQAEKDLPTTDPDLSPIDMEAEETVIGQVTDLSVKALFLIRMKLIEAIDLIRADLLRSVPEGMSVQSVLVASMTKANRLKRQYNIVSNLFLAGVRETLGLSAKEHPSIGIRKDWVVVHCPPKEEDEEVKEILEMLETVFNGRLL